MGNTPSMRKKFKTCDNDGLALWSKLNHDLFLLIMMRVGVFDFIAISGVCKSWRSFALSNWNKFMLTKQPMSLSISTRLFRKDCYLEDYTKRKLKTTVPRSNGSFFLGITCGYLIFLARKTNDFWLVNPLTRKELHFPAFPFRTFSKTTSLSQVRGILVFSPSMSGWVFVVSEQYSNKLSFSLAGNQARWKHISCNPGIQDFHFLNGKIYVINTDNHLFELRLNPEPTLTLHEMKNLPRPMYRDLEIVSSGVNLYLRVGFEDAFTKVDVDGMKWMSSEKTIEEYAVFYSNYVRCGAAIKPDTWTYPWTQYKKLNRPQWHKDTTKTMWYFPHECLNDNDSGMENGALLNILKE